MIQDFKIQVMPNTSVEFRLGHRRWWRLRREGSASGIIPRVEV